MAWRVLRQGPDKVDRRGLCRRYLAKNIVLSLRSVTLQPRIAIAWRRVDLMTHGTGK